MKDEFEVEIMQRLDLFGGMVEGIRIEFERAVAGVPAIGAIAGAQINQAVAGEMMVAEGTGDLQRVFGAEQRAVRFERYLKSGSGVAFAHRHLR